MKSFSIFRLYNVKEIAEITGFKVDKITLLLRKGTLVGKKTGKIWFSRGWEIRKLMSENSKLEELKNRFRKG